MQHSYVLEPSDWLRVAIALAACLVLLAAYGLAVVEIVVGSRRPR